MTREETEILLRLNLLENGIDFILKGIDDLFDEEYIINEYYGALHVSPNGYKYGYLHLFSGFLLLLKERLSRHMPELIYKGKLSEIKKKLAGNGKEKEIPNTVDFDEALERLEIGPKVVFSEKDLKIIRNMQSFRNQFEHFEISANKHQLWSIVSGFLIIVDNFLVKELQINIETSAGSQELLNKIQSIETVWQRIQKQRKEEWQIETEEKLDKFIEDQKNILDEFRQEHYISKGYFVPFTLCPNCGSETLIISGEYSGICANSECNSIFPITKCKRCYEPTIGFDWEFNFCDDCNERFDKE